MGASTSPAQDGSRVRVPGGHCVFASRVRHLAELVGRPHPPGCRVLGLLIRQAGKHPEYLYARSSLRFDNAAKKACF